MAHRNRWFTWVYLLKMGGSFHGKLLVITRWYMIRWSFTSGFGGSLFSDCWGMLLAWLCTKASQTFTGTFTGTRLNLTWLCTKASPTFSGTFSGTLLNLTWLCTKASEPSSELCWTWPASAPKPSGTFSGTFPEPCWTWLGFAAKPPSLHRTPVEPESYSGIASGYDSHSHWKIPKINGGL